MFADGLTCDNMIRFFNTRITQPPYLPIPVIGEITIAPPSVAAGNYKHVQGLRLDTAFLENNYVSCESMKGYTYGGQ